MVKKLDAIKIYEIAESGNTGDDKRCAMQTKLSQQLQLSNFALEDERKTGIK